MEYKPSYNDSAGKKKKQNSREDFKKDLADAVKKAIPKKDKVKQYIKGHKGNGGLNSWSVAELRKLLNQKKRNLLVKSGFPDGKLPRSKVGMIALCKKLKRKRW